jgi:hypothetical protein
MQPGTSLEKLNVSSSSNKEYQEQISSPGYDRRHKTLTGDCRRPAQLTLRWQRSLDGRTKQPHQLSWRGIGLGRGAGNGARLTEQRRLGAPQHHHHLPNLAKNSCADRVVFTTHPLWVV